MLEYNLSKSNPTSSAGGRDALSKLLAEQALSAQRVVCGCASGCELGGLEKTTAKLQDSQVWDDLLHGAETSV